MSPQPLSNHRPNARVRFVPTCHSRYPKLSALVMEFISEWAGVEFELGGVLAGILDADRSTTIAMLNGIRSSEASRAAIRSAVAYARPNDVQLFDAVMSAIASTRTRRNEYAHGMWGWSEDIPDALVLVESQNLFMDFMHLMDGDHPHIQTREDIGREHAFVYYARDFRQDLDRSRRAIRLVNLLASSLTDWKRSDEARKKLETLLGMA